MDTKILKTIKIACINELTESRIYGKISGFIFDKNQKEIFLKLSQDELGHHNIWKSYLKEDVKIDKIKYYFYVFIIRFFGLSFGIKLMESGEGTSQENYKKLIDKFPETKKIIEDEEKHEKQLIELIDDNKLKYMSSIVLGLNDALVEITGALAGLTITLKDGKMVAISGLIIGISAAISMAASEFLSSKEEGSEDINPLKASIYTGIAYILTVGILVVPYFLLENVNYSLVLALVNGVLVIAFFNYYIAVAKGVSFKQRFLQMTSISLGVALLSFLIGYIVNHFLGISV